MRIKELGTGGATDAVVLIMIYPFVGTVDGPAFIKIRVALGGITVTSGRRIRSVTTVGLLLSDTLPGPVYA